jgi:hypothetical protein
MAHFGTILPQLDERFLRDVVGGLVIPESEIQEIAKRLNVRPKKTRKNYFVANAFVFGLFHWQILFLKTVKVIIFFIGGRVNRKKNVLFLKTDPDEK